MPDFCSYTANVNYLYLFLIEVKVFDRLVVPKTVLVPGVLGLIFKRYVIQVVNYAALLL